jgi:drug/metabolite transporter (DMT)-like permease
MTPTVFFAALGAALLHASWNALVKGAADKRTSLSAVILGNVPFAVLALLFVPPPDPASFPRILGSIVLHLGYQLFLLRSYEKADLTQVYPIARGSAPLIVSVVSVTVLGVRLSPLELAAVGIIGVGILSLALVRRADGQRTGRATVLALVTGCFIAAYSLNDGLGAREAGTSLGFYGWLVVGNAVALALYLRLRHPEVPGRILREGRVLFWVGGGASFVAYAMVTWAFTQAPIALVAALRETSIVFALLIGVFVLKERLDLAKVASTMATLLGAALLRYSRQ